MKLHCFESTSVCCYSYLAARSTYNTGMRGTAKPSKTNKTKQNQAKPSLLTCPSICLRAELAEHVAIPSTAARAPAEATVLKLFTPCLPNTCMPAVKLKITVQVNTRYTKFSVAVASLILRLNQLSSLLPCPAEATVPKLAVITRKAYGGAYCVMSSQVSQFVLQVQVVVAMTRCFEQNSRLSGFGQ